MPRIARIVCPGTPYHITQRGNRREQVFFSDLDRRSYLADLRHYSSLHALHVLAYCLMDNHVHLVAVPGGITAMHETLKPVHLRHALRVNRPRKWRGHVWQDRYYSSALDEQHLWAAIRYVELNPVRAGLIHRAERYRWSSAAAHCGQRTDPVLTNDPSWCRLMRGVGDWSRWLTEATDPELVESLRRNTTKGSPSGSAEFVRRLEKETGRKLERRRPGRPSTRADRDASLEPETAQILSAGAGSPGKA